MPIQVEEFTEPLTRAAIDQQKELVLIRPRSYQLFLDSARAYCEGSIGGKSFLVSGHRGSGKTTLVHGAFHELREERLDREEELPILVPLHGPDILLSEERSLHDPRTPDPRAAGKNVYVQGALEQIVLALYQALVKEVTERYRVRALEEAGRDAPERSAELELELLDYVSPARLRDFWKRAGLLEAGLLQHSDPPADQAWLELLALSHAAEMYQRISGSLTQTHKNEEQATHTREVQTGGKEAQATPAIPAVLTGLLAGAGVTAGGATAFPAVASGLVASLGALTVFKLSSKRSRHQAAGRSLNFERDFSVQTLDRELPLLIEQIKRAGLHPIFVVDELDKAEKPSESIRELVKHLKKLVAEQAFFCFLTDRSYFEELETKKRTGAYPIEHTFFTHPLFIAFGPDDIHRYLSKVLALVSDRTEAQGPPPGEAGEDAHGYGAAEVESQEQAEHDERESRDGSDTELDYIALPYILLHQARMHSRDIRARLSMLTGSEGFIDLPPGQLSTATANKLDLLLQVAIEMTFSSAELQDAIERRPAFLQLALDALLYPTRMWESGETVLDLGPEAAGGFEEYLERRMIGDGSSKKATSKDEDAAESPAADSSELERPSIGEPDRDFLFGYAREVAVLLSDPFELLSRFATWRERKVELARLREEDDPGPDLTRILYLLPSLHVRGLLLRRIPAVERVYTWRFTPSGFPVAAERGRAPSAHLLDLQLQIAAKIVFVRHTAGPEGIVHPRAIELLEVALDYVEYLWRAKRSQIDLRAIGEDAEDAEAFYAYLRRRDDDVDSSIAGRCLDAVREMAGLLADPEALDKATDELDKELYAPMELTLRPPGGHRAFLTATDEAVYRFNFDPTDRSLFAEQEEEPSWEAATRLITSFRDFLENYG